MKATRIFDLLPLYLEKFGNVSDALAVKRNKKWKLFSTKEYIDNVNNLSYGLLELGLKKGDKIATVSNNRPEWNFTDMATAQAGIVQVPIYPTISTQDYEYILQHCDAKIVIVSDAKLYVKLLPIVNKLDSIQEIYTFNELEGTKNFYEIIKLGKENAKKHQAKLNEIKKSITPRDLLTIIYTSGTTVRPKGVMLCHENF